LLRIHFTPADLTKVRIASQPDPLWETVLSLWRFRLPDLPLVYQQWRREAMPRVDRRMLESLLPLLPGGYFPDFLNPAEAAQGFEAGIEAIQSTPKTRLRAEMDLLATTTSARLTPWLSALRAGEVSALQHLGVAMRSYHESAISPHWSRVQAHIDADRATRSRAFLDGGFEALVDSYRPLMQWRPPVLEVRFSADSDLYLNGRGLLLVPSYFCWNTADSLANPELPPVLVYPVQHDLALGGCARGNDSLAALLGATRAAILGTIDHGRSTGELARRVGVSAAAISQHTTVLRDANLIRTTRVGKAVVHTLTPLGSRILESAS
jgi:DNA-binding transcriptional ArsR family regulator